MAAQRSILSILAEEGRCTAAEIATRLDLDPGEVEQLVQQMERDHVILGYHALVDWDRAGESKVFAFIEVKANPERGAGFDALATHIAAFSEVHSVHLISGTHDLNVVCEGEDFRQIALFVSEKLAPLPQVVGTATSFVLKTYKLDGQLVVRDGVDHRLPVSP